MKIRVAIVLAGVALLLAAHLPAVFAQQSPAPTTARSAPATSAPAVEQTTDEEDSNTKPWIRLVWLVPLAAAVGAGSVFGRRLLIQRGCAGCGLVFVE